jgi:hypothetical protein
MRPDDTSSSLSPEQRRHAAAAILAAGLLRLSPRGPSPDTRASIKPKNLEDSQRDCLEVAPDLRLSVHNG